VCKICVPAGATPKFSKPNLTVTFPEIDSPSFGEIKYTEALSLLGDNSIACNEHESKKINIYLI
jgi:hypothetical protein